MPKFQIFWSFQRYLFALDFLSQFQFLSKNKCYIISVFLNVLRLFMHKPMYVCVSIYMARCVWSLGCRSGHRLPVPGEPCALAAEVGAESPGWEAVMCSESCLALLLRKTVSLPSSFLFVTEPMAIKNARPLPGYWLYHGKCQMHSSPTVQNGNLSFLDYQRLTALFHLLLVTFFFSCPPTPV